MADRKTELTPLELYQRALTWLCLRSCSSNTSKFKKYQYKIFAVTMTMLLASGTTSCIVYLNKIGMNDLQESLYVIYQLIGNILIQTSNLFGLILRPKIDDMFNLLSKIYDSSKDAKFHEKIIISISSLYSSQPKRRTMDHIASWLQRTKKVNGYGIFT